MILEDGAVELLNVLYPHLVGVHVERVVASGRVVRLEATTRAPEAACPTCGHPSSRVHSRYERCVADRGVGGREVSIRLRVRRFFCVKPNCSRRIFAEQVVGLTERYRRCSPALRAMLAEVGLATGGRAGAGSPRCTYAVAVVSSHSCGPPPPPMRRLSSLGARLSDSVSQGEAALRREGRQDSG